VKTLVQETKGYENMAYLKKNKNTWQLQFYVDGQKHYKHFPPNTPKSIVLAEKKRIEAEIALHKANIRKFVYGSERVDFITLRDLTERVIEIRKNEVSTATQKRNQLAMRVFMEIVGADMPISNLKTEYFDQFKKQRYESSVKKYKKRKWDIDEDKIKRGVNKDLVNVRAVIRAAVSKGIIPESKIPKIPFFKVDRNRLPKYLNDQEIIAIANQLEGEAKLAFWIIRFTGARRSEVARSSVNDDRGLKWKHIDWMRNKMRLYSKGHERLVTLHPTLRKMLLERKAELGESWNPDDHVIHFIRDTLSRYFRRAIKKAGINKPGAVHILRHTAGTKLLASSKDIRITQEFLGHKNITTTEIYTHVIQEDMDKAVKEAFS